MDLGGVCNWQYVCDASVKTFLLELGWDRGLAQLLWSVCVDVNVCIYLRMPFMKSLFCWPCSTLLQDPKCRGIWVLLVLTDSLSTRFGITGVKCLHLCLRCSPR